MTILDQSLTKALAIDDRAIDGDLVVVLEVVHELFVNDGIDRLLPRAPQLAPRRLQPVGLLEEGHAPLGAGVRRVPHVTSHGGDLQARGSCAKTAANTINVDIVM